LRASGLDEKRVSKTFGDLDDIDFFIEKWLEMVKNNARINGFTLRLSENAHLPAETAGSKELRLSALLRRVNLWRITLIPALSDRSNQLSGHIHRFFYIRRYGGVTIFIH